MTTSVLKRDRPTTASPIASAPDLDRAGGDLLTLQPTVLREKFTTMRPAGLIKALANEKRLAILAWLKDPVSHFPPQVYGDLERDGVCGVFIARKLRVSQPTASEHLRVLAHAGLIKGKRIRQWTFYRRDEKKIAELKRLVQSTW